MLVSRAEVFAWMRKSANVSEADLALYELVAPLALRAVKDYLDYDPEYALHTEYLPLGGPQYEQVDLADFEMVGGRVVPANRYCRTGRLQLTNLPVWATGLEVREDPSALGGQASEAFAAATALTVGEDFFLDMEEGQDYSESGVLVRDGGGWSGTPRSIKVTYYGGWKAAQLNGGVAATIKLAALLAVAKAFNEAVTNAQTGGAGAISSETLGKYSVSYAGTNAALSGLAVSLPPQSQELLDKFKNYGKYL